MLPATVALEVVYTFGFVPARYGGAPDVAGDFPAGTAGGLWSFLTYALLHGDWLHLAINTVWMVAFGTPVLRRFGTGRFLALSAVAALGGAAAHLFSHWGAIAPMIGASAAISGQMAAAVRFAFRPGGPIGASGAGEERRWRIPALPLHLAFRDIRVVAFVGVWFAVNIAFGAGSPVPGTGAAIAWQAHIGGFLVGLLLFRWFDPWSGAFSAGSPEPDAADRRGPSAW